MHPLIWLALPILITAVAAVVLLRRGHEGPDSDERLRRIEQALGRDD